tara:strand:+ start:118 stop:285 length:168 start_codon:yes stop_codon:yes gene_type:complete
MMDDHPDFTQLVETFRVLEAACAEMYEFMMRDKHRIDELLLRVSKLEKKLNTFVN